MEITRHSPAVEMRNMKSPFQYGGVVEGSAFCNHKKELADLTAAVESNEQLFLYSERRLVWFFSMPLLPSRDL